MTMRHTSAMKCTCKACDARGFVDTKTTGRADPTNTSDLRRRYTRQINEMWRRFGMILRQGVVDHNMLGLGGVSAASIALTIAAQPLQVNAPISESRSRAFQFWLDHMLLAAVVDPAAGVMRTGVIVTYARGVARAKKLSRTDVEPINGAGTIGALAHLALVEMQGISEAVSQQIVRTASLAAINNMKPIAVLRSMLDVIRKVGVSRSTAMVDMMIVKTHGTATLDQFEAAQIKQVGLITELKNVSGTRVGDAGRSGPGSRSHKTEGGPSARTVRRIRAAERAVEALGNVSVQTAGDDDVCPICEDIEANSPYSIDEARSLIPAHPYCRCAFIPEDEEAVSDSLVVDYNEFHDPDNGQFSSGEGGGGSSKSAALAHAFNSFAGSDKVKAVISRVAMDKHTVKKGLSFALQSLLSHGSGLDASTWKLNEDFIDHTVHHFGDIASISKLQAKAYLQKAVGQLIKLRKQKTHDAAIADRDDVLSFLLALQKALKKVSTKE